MIQIRRAWLSVLLLLLCSSSGLAQQRAGLFEKLQRKETPNPEAIAPVPPPTAVPPVPADVPPGGHH